MRGNLARRRIAGLVLVGGTALVFFTPSIAGAQDAGPYGAGRTVVGGNTVVNDPSNAATSDPVVRTGGSSTLPITGGDVVALTAMGAAAVGIGTVVSRVRRKHTV